MHTSHAASRARKPTAAPAIRLVTPKEAAELLKVSVSWLAKARVRGEGPPYIRIGRSVRYREEDLIDWLKQRRNAIFRNSSPGCA
jgi:excisionase family DNA binding protein